MKDVQFWGVILDPPTYPKKLDIIYACSRITLQTLCFTVRIEFNLILARFWRAAIGGFHLQLLVFPFIHQFNSRIGVLVHSSFAND